LFNVVLIFIPGTLKNVSLVWSCRLRNPTRLKFDLAEFWVVLIKFWFLLSKCLNLGGYAQGWLEGRKSMFGRTASGNACRRPLPGFTRASSGDLIVMEIGQKSLTMISLLLHTIDLNVGNLSLKCPKTTFTSKTPTSVSVAPSQYFFTLPPLSSQSCSLSSPTKFWLRKKETR